MADSWDYHRAASKGLKMADMLGKTMALNKVEMLVSTMVDTRVLELE